MGNIPAADVQQAIAEPMTCAYEKDWNHFYIFSPTHLLQWSSQLQRAAGDGEKQLL